jgi:hypothetical protein
MFLLADGGPVPARFALLLRPPIIAAPPHLALPIGKRERLIVAGAFCAYGNHP